MGLLLAGSSLFADAKFSWGGRVANNSIEALMRSSTVILAIFAVILTVGTPFFIARNLQLGSYAKSPQEVRLSLGGRATIAGGRAKLWYAGGDTGSDFEIEGRQSSRYFRPEDNQTCEACGVEVKVLEVDTSGPVPKARFRVTWN